MQHEVSWDEVQRLCEHIAQYVRMGADAPIDGVDAVVGIARGGVIPATILSYQFEKSTLYTATIQLRNGGNVDKEAIDYIKHRIQCGDRILVMDDICDGGETFARLVKEWNWKTWRDDCAGAVMFASLFKRHSSKFKTVYAPLTINNDNWVVFPWDQQSVPSLTE